MLNLLRIHAKSLRFQLPLAALFLLVLFTVSYLDAHAAGGQADARIHLVVCQEADDALSRRYLDAIKRIDALQLREVGAASSAAITRAFDDPLVQGFVIIPADFSANCAQGQAEIRYSPAPGSTSSNLATEYLSNAVLTLQADQLLDARLKKLGVDRGDVAREQKLRPQIVLDYQGPRGSAQQASPFTPARFGPAALLFLFAFLSAAWQIPGRDDRRIMLQGVRALRRSFFAATAVCVCYWMLLLAVYFAILRLVFQVVAPPLVALAFVILVLYAISAGACLALFGRRKAAPAVFLLWLLVAMTLGGGLWGVTTSAKFAVLSGLPAVLTASAGKTGALWMLAALVGCLWVVIGVGSSGGSNET